MYALSLSPDARSQLALQVTESGTFSHALYAENGICYATAYVVIEQGAGAISVQVRLGSSVNSITLKRRKDSAERLAEFLEELANAGESDVQGHLTISILEPNAKRLFSQSIEGYRAANADLDAAITLGNWGAINQAQGRRDLHASTIALIVNQCSAEVGEGVRR